MENKMDIINKKEIRINHIEDKIKQDIKEMI